MSQDYGDEVQRALARLHRVAGVPVTYGGLVRDAKSLHLSDLFGTTGNSLAGLSVQVGRGLGGRTLALGRPITVSDYHSATTISHDYDQPVRDEGIRSAIAVPVVVRRVVKAVLYCARREPVLLGDQTIQAAIAAGRDVEQDLVVRDEVDRRIALLERNYVQPSSADSWQAAARETVRQAHAELRVLAAQSDDADVRRRVHRACAALSRANGSSQAREIALAPREVDVLACAALGHTNAEIAAELGIEAETVKSYLRSAMRRLDAHTRLQAVVAARRAGLLP
jgi:DNA-binding CsgD family transcriptional regulator